MSNCSRFSVIAIWIFTGLISVAGTELLAQSEKEEIDKNYRAKSDNWRFIVSPYALLASQSTDVGTNQLRQSFSDLASLTNIGFQMSAVIMHKNWLLTTDGTFADLGTDAVSGPVQADLSIKQYILDLRIGYLLLNNVNYKNESEVVRGWSLEVNAGAKYWENDVNLSYTVTPPDPLPQYTGSTEDKQYWWDLMLGSKARIYMSRTFLLGIYASYGGFGLGNSSKYSWDFLYTNTFKVSGLILVTGGFRSFKYKRTDPGKDGDIETNVHVYGPLIGVSFSF